MNYIKGGLPTEQHKTKGRVSNLQVISCISKLRPISPHENEGSEKKPYALANLPATRA